MGQLLTYLQLKYTQRTLECQKNTKTNTLIHKTQNTKSDKFKNKVLTRNESELSSDGRGNKVNLVKKGFQRGGDTPG